MNFSTQSPYCIAEVGLNHNGSISRAKEMIVAAKAAGANAVKFQTFKASELCGDPDQTYSYKSAGETVTESMYDMFKRYELPEYSWRELKDFADSNDIDFFSTPQNLSDLNLLIPLSPPFIKVGSDDFTNLPLLRSYRACNIPLILSCGMSDIGEVHNALDVTGWYEGNDVSVLVCTSLYPTPSECVNIRRVSTLLSTFPGLKVGFSDHTIGSNAAVMAVALGAQIFEKHFTLSNDLPGPDHTFSENPQSLKAWIDDINSAFSMLGSGLIKPALEELSNRKEFRRYLVASSHIKSGEKYTSTNVTMKRLSHGSGLPPIFFDYLQNNLSPHDYNPGDPIKL